MVSPPKGTVFLTNSPLSKDNEHQIKFNSEQEQQTYFNSLEGKQFSYNYVRHENTMIVPCDYYEAIKYNYVVYQNTYVNDKS
ncbi:hypothetical protein, partial [Clostridium beijerinckii]|uniref:hypothetical protein n=1 Tax=Clostridium beijerinckii TaxID=1520 RepID=UPI001115701A